MTIALTREVSPAIDRCQLTHIRREPIDVGRAREQHLAYEQVLSGLGCEVRRAPAAPDLPDSVFVEDAAVVLDEVAVITRPGAASRRPETEGVAEALSTLRPLVRMREPATLDGGDVLRVGHTLFVGHSGRTNEGGVEQLHDAVERFGYTVQAVTFEGCLHLKSAVSEVAPGLLLLNPRFVSPDCFEGMRAIEVDPAEPLAANALRLGDVVIYAEAFHETRRRIEAEGIAVVTVAIAELAKAEGGVTCCSLLLKTGAGRR